MHLTLKKMETEEEIRGKAFVHWRAWHEAYPGLVCRDYLDKLTLEKCEHIAFLWPDGIIVAKEGERVIGFVGYGDRVGEASDTGEIFALYVLREYYGTGAGARLMEAGLAQLNAYPRICLWVLKGNARAIRFYQKQGFHADGAEQEIPALETSEIRMVLTRQHA